MRTLVLSSILLLAAPAFAQDAAPPTAAGSATAGKRHRKELLDINTASEDDLKALPGMTDDIAKKIIAGRPYTGKDQLMKQNIVDKDEYAKIRPLIHAKQPKAIGGQGAADAHTGPGPASGAAQPSGTAAKPATPPTK